MRIPTGLFVLALCCAPAYGAGNTGSMASDADTLAREAIEGYLGKFLPKINYLTEDKKEFVNLP